MTSSPPALCLPKDPAAPVIPAGLGLNDLSEDEFALLVSQGGTITIGQLNARLKVIKVDANSLAALGVTLRRERGAVHMAAAGFRHLCEKLQEHVADLKRSEVSD